MLIGFSVPEGWRRRRWETAWFVVALGYALSAFLEWYGLTLLLSLPLLTLVEWVRVRRFSWFPWVFFSRSAPVRDKLHHASLLCLACGIAIASLVILNEHALPVVIADKLTLDVFFLGYSFPISLITMSVMFSFLPRAERRLHAALDELVFWTVNVGVILFFLFIILENTAAELVASLTLFAAVSVLFVQFLRRAPDVPERAFLLSGMVFLLCTASSGVLYILRYAWPALDPWGELLLTVHATVSLYGWNLSGLFVIIRRRELPIGLNQRRVIALHWLVVLVLAPLGKVHLAAAAVALPAWVLLLSYMLFAEGDAKAS